MVPTEQTNVELHSWVVEELDVPSVQPIFHSSTSECHKQPIDDFVWLTDFEISSNGIFQPCFKEIACHPKIVTAGLDGLVIAWDLQGISDCFENATSARTNLSEWKPLIKVQVVCGPQERELNLCSFRLLNNEGRRNTVWRVVSSDYQSGNG